MRLEQNHLLILETCIPAQTNQFCIEGAVFL